MINSRHSSTLQKLGGAKRLRYRYELLFGQTGHLFDGKRVIDFGSHDGRWSFCALQHGASFVHGIEAHEQTGLAGIENYKKYGVDDNRYEFVFGDLFTLAGDLLSIKNDQKFQIGLCLGFLYHTARHFETIAWLDRFGCDVIIVETQIMQDERDTKVKYRLEEVGPAHNAFSDNGTHGGKTLSAIPSESAVTLLLESFGYDVTILPLPSIPIYDNENVSDWAWDFRIGRRLAFMARR